MDPIFSHQFAMPAPKKKGGMFGGVTIDPSAFLAAFAAGMGSPAGAQALEALHRRKLLEQQQGLEEKRYQRERTDKRDDFIFEQDYRAQHQAPDEFTRAMQAAGIDPASEAGKGLFLQYVQNKANPFTQMRVQNPDGSESLQFMRPPMTPTAPVGNLRPLGAGGAGAQPPRNFLGY
jgi:hypothetical protein